MPENIIPKTGGMRIIEMGSYAKLCRHMIYGTCPFCKECEEE